MESEAAPALVRKSSDSAPALLRKSSVDELYPEKSRIDFKRFQEIFAKIKENSLVDAKVHWEQIRTVLKGSVEAIVQNNSLTLEQYLNMNVFPYKRVRLNAEERKDVYALFVRYKIVQSAEKLWDDVDKVNDLKVKRTNKVQPSLQPDVERTCDILSFFLIPHWLTVRLVLFCCNISIKCDPGRGVEYSGVEMQGDTVFPM